LASGDSDNYGYESMEGLKNLGSPVARGPIYESVKLEQNSQPEESGNNSVYGSLVGNDPHVYGSLNVPHKTPEEDVGGQVTCTLPNKEDTYQQLNLSGQRCNDEYQALSYNDETKVWQ
jgi:hypothetical protein